MSQQYLAKKLGYKSDTAISLIESGERKLAIDKLTIIADLFKVTLAELLGEDYTVEHPTVLAALRAEGLEEKDVAQISDFIDFIKQKDKGGESEIE